MRYNPHLLIEGMAIAAYTMGVKTAITMCTARYSRPMSAWKRPVNCTCRGYLGDHIMGTDFCFDLHNHLGYGAYICGEETALLNPGRQEGPAAFKPHSRQLRAVWQTDHHPTIPKPSPASPTSSTTAGRIPGTGRPTMAAPSCSPCPAIEQSGQFRQCRWHAIQEAAGNGRRMRGGRKLKACIPVVRRCGVARRDHDDLDMDYDSISKAGSMLAPAR